MKLRLLKKIRIIVSLIFFLGFCILFLDFTSTFSESFRGTASCTQFLPSLFKFIKLITFSSTGFIVIILITFLIGRVYCSSLCPLGTLQDIISFISKKRSTWKKYKYSHARNFLRYSVLFISSLMLIFGFIKLINYTDPYSNFGRIVIHIFKPFVVLINYLLSYAFGYSMNPAVTFDFQLIGSVFSIAFLILIVWLAFRKGRLYCNTLCPVGSFLALLSHFSLLKLKIDKITCENCGSCERVCKASCIDSKNKTLDFTRCISCFNCIGICPSRGIKYKTSFRIKKTTSTNNGSNYP